MADTDDRKRVPEQMQRGSPGTVSSLGTDGGGRSDSRKALREFFEVDRRYIVVTTLKALADEGQLNPKIASDAIDRFGIDRNKTNPRLA